MAEVGRWGRIGIYALALLALALGLMSPFLLGSGGDELAVDTEGLPGRDLSLPSVGRELRAPGGDGVARSAHSPTAEPGSRTAPTEVEEPPSAIAYDDAVAGGVGSATGADVTSAPARTTPTPTSAPRTPRTTAAVASTSPATTAPPATRAPQPVSGRNYLAQPFNSYSFWNLPVHTDAWSNGYYKPANLQPLTYRSSSAHNDLLFLDPSAPERQVFRTPLSSAWSNTGLTATQNRVQVRCNSATERLPGPMALIPDGFSTITDLPGLGATPDLPSAILNPASAFPGLSVRETQPLEVCPDGKVVAAVDYARDFPIDKRGDGRCGTSSGGGSGVRTATCPTGSQGATGLPAVGGLIRRGEFSAGEIRHALKLSLPVGELYGRNNELNPAGFVWPANGLDSYADVNGGGYCGDADGRAGTNKYIYSGSQYVLNPNFDMSSLQSSPGRIVARALRDYGAYVVDTLGPPCSSNPFAHSERTLHVEMGPGMNDGRPDVRGEFRNLYGYDMDVLVSGPQTPFSSDMAKIWSETYVMWHPCMNDQNPNGGACAKFVGGGPTCDPASKRRGPIVSEGSNRAQCPSWAR